MRRRRGHEVTYRLEAMRCVCEPGPNAHPAHGRPAAKVARHLDPKCPHSELALTTRPRTRARRSQSFRIEL